MLAMEIAKRFWKFTMNLYHFKGGTNKKKGGTKIWPYRKKRCNFALVMSNLQQTYQQWQALQPLPEDLQQRLDRKFMLEFNYHSNHIEGNTLTYGQTELLLLFGKVVDEANMRDLEEMKAHNVGLKMMQEAALDPQLLTETFIRQLHHTLLREDYEVHRTLPDGSVTSYTVHAGQYKTRPNSVITPTGEQFEYASPEETPALMTDLLTWYQQAEQEATLTPVQLAALFHYRYIRIHPFEDGNGRIARLIVNYILRRHHYPMIIVPTTAKQTYLTALHRCDLATGPIPADGAHATLQQIASFEKYLTERVLQTLRDNIGFAEAPIEQKWWFNGVVVDITNTNTIAILQALTDNPRITVRTLSEQIGINKSAVQKQLKTLQEKGYITRDKGWQVHITCVR